MGTASFGRLEHKHEIASRALKTKEVGREKIRSPGNGRRLGRALRDEEAGQANCTSGLCFPNQTTARTDSRTCVERKPFSGQRGRRRLRRRLASNGLS